MTTFDIVSNKINADFSQTVNLGFEIRSGKAWGRDVNCQFFLLLNLHNNVVDIGIACDGIGAEGLGLVEGSFNILEWFEDKKRKGEFHMGGDDFDTNTLVFSKVVYLYVAQLYIQDDILVEKFKGRALWLKIRKVDVTGPAKKIALVIGNSNYEHLKPLPNPVNDAQIIRDSISALGFETIFRTNVLKSDMDTCIKQLGEIAPEKEILLIYYAGHGYYHNGAHYLVPIDVDVLTPTDLEENCVRLDVLLNASDVSSISKRIVIVDACRLPTPKHDYQSAAMEKITYPDTFIAFATSVGAAAKDGKRKNSPFTESIVSHIRTKGHQITDVFSKVNAEVTDKTDGQQIPWYSSSLRSPFFFNP